MNHERERMKRIMMKEKRTIAVLKKAQRGRRSNRIKGEHL